MATKKITDLQLIDAVTDDVNFPADDGIQSYRVTAPQIAEYILVPDVITATELDTDAVETLKIKDLNVTLAKLAATVQAALCPVGSVLAFAGTSAPTGFLLCNGSAVSRTTYSALFALIASTHGQGDGSTTFNVPDYRGRFLRGVDGGVARDPDRASRTAMGTGGNTGDNVGSVQGFAVESHNHTWRSNTGQGGSVAMSSTNTLAFNSAGAGNMWTNTLSGVTYNTANIGAYGTSTETRPVNANVNYIIKY